MQMLIIETIKLVVALAILAYIAKFPETKPLCDPFFANQKWTLSDAYKILLPLLIAVFLLFILSKLVPKSSLDTRLVLQIFTGLLWGVAIYVPFLLIIKAPHGVTASTFGLQKSEFLQAAVLPTNIVTILFLAYIFAVKSPSQVNAFPYSDLEIRAGLLLLVTMVFVVPPVEELLYRGILYPPVRRRMPKWQAIACLSLVESLSHVQATYQIFGLFLWFLLFYFVYVRSKSLYSPIILHIGSNFIAARPQIKTLLAAHIDGKTLDQCFILSILLFAFFINLCWFIRRKRDSGQTLSTPLGVTLSDGSTHKDITKDR